MLQQLSEAAHRFFFYLGTNDGTLLIRSIEVIFFWVITYMIISEFLRTKEHELRYLAIGFGIFSIEKTILTISTGLVIFSDVPLKSLPEFVPLMQFGLEMLAIVMLANAFGFSLFKKVEQKFLGSMYLQTGSFLVIIAVVEVFWLNSDVFKSGGSFAAFWGGALFTSIGMIYLAAAMMITIRGGTQNDNYKENLMLAFLAYFIALSLRLANFFFFHGTYGRFYVAEQPLPLISGLLFMRFVYLKLVDKATLRDKLKESETRLESERKVSRMKDEFVSTVSHELRTPLTSIKLYVSLLAKGKFGHLHEKQEKALKTVKDESDRLANLIDDLLDLSKLEAGKAQLKLSNFALPEFLHSNIHYQLAQEKGIKVKIKVEKNLAVKVDIPKFKQIFVNLVSNAVKFTDTGGEIIIEANSNSPNWTLSVKDTGKGIDKDKLPRLFEKFFQADDYMIRTQRGTGLGLAIVKKLVELHNGSITVESEGGKGSTFTVTMPLDPKD